MDNASKAIIMAGGILIAVAVISITLYMFANARDLASVSDRILEQSQIDSFNRFYYAYAPTTGAVYELTGLDAYNVYNKVKNNNSGKDVGDYQYIKFVDKTDAESFTNSTNFLRTYTIVVTTNPANGIIDSVTIDD